MKKSLFSIVFAMLLLAVPALSPAHVYDRDDSDYPLRYIAYAVHPIGIAVEYAVFRPIHWLVSKPNCAIIFGHDPRPEEEQGTYFEWE